MTHHFLIVNARNGESKDYGFKIPEVFNWTPDGQHIIYDRTFLDPSRNDCRLGVSLMRISDGSEVARISRFAGDSSGAPALSPSGKLVYWDCYELRSFFLVPNPLNQETFKSRISP